MNFPIKPICDSRFIRKDGTAFIYMQYCYSAKSRTLLNTKIAIPPVYWNQKKECVSEKLPEKFGQADEINFELKRMMRTVEDLTVCGTKKEPLILGNLLRKHR